jgi:hypothetical protein
VREGFPFQSAHCCAPLFQQLTRAACQLQHQRGHPTTKAGTDPEEDAHALDNFCNRAIAVASGLGVPRCWQLDSPVVGGSGGHPGDPVDHRTQSSCLAGENNFGQDTVGGTRARICVYRPCISRSRIASFWSISARAFCKLCTYRSLLAASSCRWT